MFGSVSFLSTLPAAVHVAPLSVDFWTANAVSLSELAVHFRVPATLSYVVRVVDRPVLCVLLTYNSQGTDAIRGQGATTRRDAVAAAAQSLGGSMESFYFAFGEHDLYTVLDLPDHQAAAAIALTVNASGTVRTDTTVLLEPEDVDAAAQRSIEYRAPGS